MFIGVNLSHNTECINICSKTRKHITRDWIQNENSVLKWILNIVVMGLTLSSICSYIPTAFYISCNIKFRSTINFRLVKIYLDQQPILYIGLLGFSSLYNSNKTEHCNTTSPSQKKIFNIGHILEAFKLIWLKLGIIQSYNIGNHRYHSVWWSKDL